MKNKVVTYKLTILKEDESIYWVEHFNSKDACDAWLAEEMTRPYWLTTFTTNVDELK